MTMKKTKPRPSNRSRSEKYESSHETKKAIARIHRHFEESRKGMAVEKARAASPEGVLRTTLSALLQARKAIVATRKELDQAIVTLRRSLPRHEVRKPS